jgi:hypothetical protein
MRNIDTIKGVAAQLLLSYIVFAFVYAFLGRYLLSSRQPTIAEISEPQRMPSFASASSVVPLPSAA